MFDASFYVSDDEPDNYASLVESSADEAIKNNDDLAIVTYKDQEVGHRGCDLVDLILKRVLFFFSPEIGHHQNGRQCH